MAGLVVLMRRRSRSYGCVIQNGEKLETELIKIPMVHLPLGAMENRVCPFGGFAWTTCCACATMAVAAMTTTTEATSAVAAVMVTVKVRIMATVAMASVMAAMVARNAAVTAAVMANLHL